MSVKSRRLRSIGAARRLFRDGNQMSPSSASQHRSTEQPLAWRVIVAIQGGLVELHNNSNNNPS
jgi:hypothetical protein